MGTVRAYAPALAIVVGVAHADAPVTPKQTVATRETDPAPHEPATTEESKPKKSYGKWISAGVVGAMHLGYATWSYFAWYGNSATEDFHLEGPSPAFGIDTYAGGADKLGHFWSNYALTRATTEVLVLGGWNRLGSSLVAGGLTEIAFTLTELEDGFVKYGFDYKDVIANVSGAAFAVVMSNVPAVDRLLDFRLEYFPSRDYRRSFETTGSVDMGQDYSGQSYLLALHLGALPYTDHDALYWTRFVDVAIGFEAKHYSPTPEMRVDAPRQTMYAGVAVNMQYVLAHLFADSTGRRIGRGFFEVYSIPFTTLRYVEASRQR